MSLQLNVDKVMPDVNIFNLRQKYWTEDHIIQHVKNMLEPIKKYNIEILNVEFRDAIYDSKYEIKKSYIKNLVINIRYNGEDQELSYNVPWLIDNRFYIAGNNKICLYQLFDRPLICKNSILTVRTNISTFSIKYKKKDKYKYHFCFFNKMIPFAYILYAYLGETELKRKFNINDTNEYIGTNDIQKGIYKLVPDIITVLTTELNKDKLFTFKNRGTQKDVIEDILLITQIDIFSKKFMYTENIIEEILYGFEKQFVDDTDYNLKRIRFCEHILYSFLAVDFYNLTMIAKSKKGKYNNNSKAILSNLNISPTCQFDFNLNPLSELIMLTRMTVTGVGGFNKDNVPPHLRDIYASMYEKVCPCDTGDRENCGTNQHLVPNISFDKTLSFEKSKSSDITSVAVEHVPFMEHNDQTRLQMSSSQQRHAIMLKKLDLPIIQSGLENIYTDYSTFKCVSKNNGIIVHRDTSSIVTKYDNGECEIFFIGYKKLYLNICDFYHTYFDVGDKIVKGDIIAESNYFKNGRLRLGKNLQTAVMIYNGYNYEDAIILSDKLVKEDYFTSTHYLDFLLEIPNNKILLNLNDNPKEYKLLPEVGDLLKKGEILAKIKSVKNTIVGNDAIFDDYSEKMVTEDCRVVDIQIYCNDINIDFPQYKKYIQKLIEDQTHKRQKMTENFNKFLSPDEVHVFLDKMDIYHADKGKGNFKIKGEKIDGLRIEITALYERPIDVGDKLGNRHGNKGVISTIIPEEQMPVINGKKVDIIINPLGVPSRMNVGQLFELHLAQSIIDLKAKVKELIKIESYDTVKEYIINYVNIIDKTKEKYIVKQVKNYLDKIDGHILYNEIDDFYMIQPPFESINWEDLQKAMEYTSTLYEAKCFDPVQNQYVENDIAFGWMYFMKLNHLAKDKMAQRGLGPYSTKTCQPLDGKARKGGQRLGEMEIWALAAHGATKNLNECLTIKSDSIRKRNKYIAEKIYNDESLLDDNDDEVSQAVRLFQTNLRVIGLDYKIVNDVFLEQKIVQIKDEDIEKLKEEMQSLEKKNE